MGNRVTAPLRMGRTEWLLLAGLSVLWGASFFFYKVMDSELPVFTIVLGRVGLAAVTLNLWLAVRRDAMTRMPGAISWCWAF